MQIGNFEEEPIMREGVKAFTFVTGHGETMVEPKHEDHINQWLSTANGELVNITQSESVRQGGGHHVTVCVWYMPDQT
jgi:hypothetical protein